MLLLFKVVSWQYQLAVGTKPLLQPSPGTFIDAAKTEILRTFTFPWVSTHLCVISKEAANLPTEKSLQGNTAFHS